MFPRTWVHLVAPEHLADSALVAAETSLDKAARASLDYAFKYGLDRSPVRG
jgi:hypothetical protein